MQKDMAQKITVVRMNSIYLQALPKQYPATKTKGEIIRISKQNFMHS